MLYPAANGWENVYFKVDTEAEVSAESTVAFEALGRPNLQTPTRTFCTPEGAY